MYQGRRVIAEKSAHLDLKAPKVIRGKRENPLQPEPESKENQELQAFPVPQDQRVTKVIRESRGTQEQLELRALLDQEGLLGQQENQAELKSTTMRTTSAMFLLWVPLVYLALQGLQAVLG